MFWFLRAAFLRKQNCFQGAEVVFFRINDVDMSKACKIPKKATFIQVVGNVAATMGTLCRKIAKY